MHHVNIYLNIIGAKINNTKAKYYFNQINTSNIEEPTLYKIFYAKKNKKSEAEEAFWALSREEQAEVIWLIERMITLGPRIFNNPRNIKWKLKGFNYGEIKTAQSRFFFFRVIKDNLIFFGYDHKDQDSLGIARYKQLDNKRKEYEREFKREKNKP